MIWQLLESCRQVADNSLSFCTIYSSFYCTSVYTFLLHHLHHLSSFSYFSFELLKFKQQYSFYLLLVLLQLVTFHHLNKILNLHNLQTLGFTIKINFNFNSFFVNSEILNEKEVNFFRIMNFLKSSEFGKNFQNLSEFLRIEKTIFFFLNFIVYCLLTFLKENTHGVFTSL